VKEICMNVLFIIEDEQLEQKALDGIKEKLEMPLGPELLEHIAYIFDQEAKTKMGRYLGIENLIAGIKRSTHLTVAAHGLFVQESILEKNLYQDQGDMVNESMYLMWKFGKFEIEKILRRVCQLILDKNITEPLLKSRSESLYFLSKIYQREVDKVNPEKKSVKGKINGFKNNIFKKQKY